jgi:hypothetical protein
MIAFILFSIPFGDVLSQPLPIPVVDLTGQLVIAATLVGLLGFYALHRVRAAVARRREADREPGGDE